MAKLDFNGFEVVDSTPIETIVQLPERPSMVDIIRQQILRAKAEMDEEPEVDDIDEMDFEDSENFIGDGGPHVVSDDVPDKIDKSMLEVSPDNATPPSTAQDSVSKKDQENQQVINSNS